MSGHFQFSLLESDKIINNKNSVSLDQQLSTLTSESQLTLLIIVIRNYWLPDYYIFAHNINL